MYETKTSELLLMKYNIKHKGFCIFFMKSFVSLACFINSNSLVLVFLFDMANTNLFNLVLIS